ncbi:hypothetical protein EFB14_19615 [Rhizobium fabae]|uniref:Uncharacterized protein n=1 Tax=Rhizobium fabae TaxID=573179 RepID=A0ABY0B6B3_9HYPH|nr:hypothetical protein EFB14_19615 [Rhizobium fabae]
MRWKGAGAACPFAPLAGRRWWQPDEGQHRQFTWAGITMKNEIYQAEPRRSGVLRQVSRVSCYALRRLHPSVSHCSCRPASGAWQSY